MLIVLRDASNKRVSAAFVFRAHGGELTRELQHRRCLWFCFWYRIREALPGFRVALNHFHCSRYIAVSRSERDSGEVEGTTIEGE